MLWCCIMGNVGSSISRAILGTKTLKVILVSDHCYKKMSSQLYGNTMQNSRIAPLMSQIQPQNQKKLKIY